MASPSAEARQVLGFVLAFGALAVSAAVLFPRVLGMAAGPEAEALSVLKRTEGRFIDVAVPGAATSVRSNRHHYDRITVSADGGRAVASATLDFDGAWGETRVSSLGFEEVPLLREGGEWKPELGPAPRLAQVLATLERRRRALESGEPVALEALRAGGPDAGDDGFALDRVWQVSGRQYRVAQWLIRSERDGVRVTEHYRLTGNLRDKPVDERGQRQFRLVPRGREFFFFSSLM